jgi:hypothetical protein
MTVSPSAHLRKLEPRLVMAPCLTTPPEAWVEDTSPAQLGSCLAVGKRETSLSRPSPAGPEGNPVPRRGKDHRLRVR